MWSLTAGGNASNAFVRVDRRSRPGRDRRPRTPARRNAARIPEKKDHQAGRTDHDRHDPDNSRTQCQPGVSWADISSLQANHFRPVHTRDAAPQDQSEIDSLIHLRRGTAVNIMNLPETNVDINVQKKEKVQDSATGFPEGEQDLTTAWVQPRDCAGGQRSGTSIRVGPSWRRARRTADRNSSAVRARWAGTSNDAAKARKSGLVKSTSR